MNGTDTSPTAACGPTGTLVSVWGIVGVLLLLANAIWRLTPMALEPLLGGELTAAQAMCYAGSVVFMGYSEGYRGFQQRFSPRVVARAVHLGQTSGPGRGVLAPLYCMSLFHASRRGKAIAWGVVVMVCILITLLRMTPQPWRGIVDGGVVVALWWGAGAIVYFSFRALRGRSPQVALDLPGEE